MNHVSGPSSDFREMDFSTLMCARTWQFCFFSSGICWCSCISIETRNFGNWMHRLNLYATLLWQSDEEFDFEWMIVLPVEFANRQIPIVVALATENY